MGRISFVDSDDWIDPDQFSVCIAAMEENGAEIAVCGCHHVTEDGRAILFDNAGTPCLYSSESAVRDVLMHGKLGYGACAKTYKAGLLEGLQFPKKMHEDLFFSLEALKRANKLAYVGAPLHYYRQRSASLIKGVSIEKDWGIYRNQQNVKKWVEKNMPSCRKDVHCFQTYCDFNIWRDIVVHSMEEEGRELLDRVKPEMRKHLPDLLRCGNMDAKSKIQAILLAVGLFKPVYRLIKRKK